MSNGKFHVTIIGKVKYGHVTCFLLFVVKSMGSHSSKLIQSVCQWFRIVVLLGSDRVDHYHMSNSAILT